MFTLNVNVILLYRAYLITFSFSQMAIDKFNSEDGSILQNTPTLTKTQRDSNTNTWTFQ